MARGLGSYPADWPEIADWVKSRANWCCVRCGHPHDRASGHILTVHHLNGDKADCVWFNLAALCQRCHLSIQGRVNMQRPWLLAEHSEWFKPYAAGHYARRYLGIEPSREEVMAWLDELLALERRAYGLGAEGDWG